MDHRVIHRGNQKRRVGAWGRGVSFLCVIVLALTCLVGCDALVFADEMAALRAELEGKIALLEKNYATALDKITTLTDNNKKAEATIAELLVSNQQLQTQVESLKSAYTASMERIATLEAARASMRQQISALETAGADAQATITVLQKELTAVESEIDALQATIRAAEAEITRLGKEIQKLEERIDAARPTGKIRIYVDQGHNPTGKHNAGASGNGLYEQDLTFTVGTLLAQLLQKDGRFEVCLSRPTAGTVLGTDNQSSLQARVAGAQMFGADYFISIHTNSFESASANGIEVYAIGEGSTSYLFGEYLLDSLVNETQLRDRGMKQGTDLYVLKNAAMPAVLVELGFISNAADAALLSQKPELFAKGMYHGILTYFGLAVD